MITLKNSIETFAGGFWTIDSDSMNCISKWIGGNYLSACGNTTGIGESKNNNEKVNIYPNPATEQITIEFKAATQKAISIEIKNLLGQEVKNIASKDISSAQLIEIDVMIYQMVFIF